MKVFISYRRDDDPDLVDRFFETLCREYGEDEVFYDQTSIAGGHDYVDRMLQQAAGSEVIVVMIGANWQAGRLAVEDDAVREELEAAFTAGVDICPVLMGDGATMPTEGELPDSLKRLRRINAVQLGSGPAYRRDMPHVISTLESLMRERKAKQRGHAEQGAESGLVSADADLSGSTFTLNLSYTDSTDDDLMQALDNLHGHRRSRLRKVDLSGTGITDEGLKNLLSLHTLTSLSLRETQVTDEGLSGLSTLPSLRALDLASTQITDAGLRPMSRLTGLTHLMLEHTQVTDAGLMNLSRLRGLASLSVAYCEGITAAGLAFLEPLTQMQILDISGLAITDSSLSCLSRLQEMIALDLSYCEQITDAGLAHLSVLTKLESLTLDDTQVTDQGVDTLLRYLPDCAID